MTTPILKLYPSAPSENAGFADSSRPQHNNDLEQRLKKKIIDVNSFKASINNNTEMITYLEKLKVRSKKTQIIKHSPE